MSIINSEILNDSIIKPKAANKMDYEVEVALVIGHMLG